MTSQETFDHFAVELEHVARQFRAGRVDNEEIETLVHAINVIRGAAGPPEGTEAEIVARFEAARTEQELAGTDVEAFFWPIVKAATTEAEARAVLRRIPAWAVLKAFAMDHFVYKSKVIPPVVRP